MTHSRTAVAAHVLAATATAAFLIGARTSPSPELATASPTQAGPQLNVAGNIGGAGVAVATFGNHAVLGLSSRFVVFDISDPSDPILVGKSSTLPRSISKIVVSEDLAYVAYHGFDGSATQPIAGGIVVFDLSIPAQPVILGSLATLARAKDMVLVGNFLIVADGQAGVRVVDVSEPSSPSIVGEWASQSTWGVAASGDTAYAMGSSGISVIDITNASEPRLVTTLQDPSTRLNSILAQGAYLYTSGGIGTVEQEKGGASVYDITLPMLPQLLGHVDNLVSPGERLATHGDLLIMATTSAGVQLVDVSDPAMPTKVGQVSNLMATDVAVAGDGSLLVSEGWMYSRNGLTVLSLQIPAAPQVLSQIDVPVISDMAVAGATAYLADYDAGLLIYDFSVPSGPIFLGSIGGLGQFTTAVSVQGTYVFVCSQSVPNSTTTLRVIDVANPMKPTVVGETTVPTRVAQAVADGSHVYLAATNNGLVVVDVSQPTAPSVVGVLASMRPTRVAISGDVVYAIGTSGADRGLFAIDVEDPSAPAIISHLAGGPSGLQDVAVNGTTIVLAAQGFSGSGVTSTMNGALYTVDGSNPASLQLTGNVSLPNPAGDVAVSEGHAFVGADDLLMVDLSNPSLPIVIGSMYTPGPSYQVAPSGTTVLVREAGVLLAVVDGWGPALDRLNAIRRASIRTFIPSALKTR